MNLEKLFTDSMNKYLESGKLEEVIDQKIEKTMTDIVDSIFAWNGDLYKNMKQKMTESMAVNFNDLTLPMYNHLILEHIQNTVNDTVTEKALPGITERIEAILQSEPKDYKLSEILAELAETVDGLEDLDYGESHEMSLHIDNTYNLTVIYFDERPDLDDYECKYRIFLSSDKTISSATIRGREYANKNQIGADFHIKQVLDGLYGIDETLFKIYVSGSRLDVDEEQCVTTLYNPNEN